MKLQILITSRSFSTGTQDLVGQLQAAGLDVVRGPAGHDLPTLGEALGRAVGWIAGTGPITAEHLDRAPHLRVLARYGVGVEAVDLAAAAARGVVVTNTPGANSDAVADHALALLLARVRDVGPGDRRVRRGDWSVRRGRELGSLTVGVLGFGRIGQGVARRLAGFGTTVLAHDPFLDDEQIRAAGAEPVAADELPARCDAVSLHAPGGHRVVDARWLSRARPGLVLVNTARADLIDEDAVAAALRSGHLAGYAADTLATEGRGTGGRGTSGDLAAEGPRPEAPGADDPSATGRADEGRAGESRSVASRSAGGRTGGGRADESRNVASRSAGGRTGGGRAGGGRADEGRGAEGRASEGRGAEGPASPLLAADLADLVVVTPHTGAQTVEAVDRMGMAATADLLAVLSGGAPRHPVHLVPQKEMQT